jgi:DNA ligase (NAD+)
VHSQQEYILLVEEMTEHDKHYYDECKPLISDFEYDQNMHELIRVEKEHPDWALPQSPTQRVSEGPTKGFVQKAHLVPMQSLANTYSETELSDFVKRVHKLLEKKMVDFCCELKMDGTAISLTYKKGRLFHALTRGNGQMGDDVTENIKTIKSVPLEIKGPDLPDLFEVRGEVHLLLSTFRNLNQQREEEGLEPFANPRNAAAGSLKLLDPREVAKRKLNLVTYAIAENQSPRPTQIETLHYLKELGFPVSKPEHVAKAHDLEGIWKFAEKIQELRPDLPFEIDGIVVKVDDLRAHDILGVTGKTPRYAVAYKFAPEEAITRVNDIAVQVGRSGVLTPVAELEPVHLAGSTIARATLHNADEVARKDIRIGDWVAIEKGGDVIPKVTRVDFKRRPHDAKPWKMPKHCPICKTEVVHREGEVAVRCPNPKCAGQRVRRIIYFAGKQAMDIEHMGERVVEQLVEKGLIARVSDIYILDDSMLAQMDGFKEKSIRNLLESIDASRKCPFSRFIMGLGIKYVGTETADLLAESVHDLDHLMRIKEEELLQIEGIGEKTAKAICDYFQDKDHIEEIRLLLRHGVQPQRVVKKIISGHPFSGKTFVLTGALEHFSRDEASKLIKERGGHVAGSVSNKTDYVLVGSEPGSKLAEAEKRGIQILSEAQFKKMLE